MVEAKYIKRIEIDSLWSGRKHIDWHLRPDVNILSGINGIGKSTILNESITSLNMMMTDAVLHAADSLTTSPFVSNVEGKRNRS